MSEDLDVIRARMRAELEARLAAVQTPQAPRAGGVREIMDGDLSTLLRENEWVFLDLWAPWCGPCRMFAPVFQAAEARYGEHAVFAKMNVDVNPVTSQALRIQSIPTLMVFHNGEVVQRQAGAMPGPMFDAFVRSMLGG